MNKQLVTGGIVLAVLAGLAFPVSNLLVKPDRQLPEGVMTGKTEAFEKAGPIFLNKCLDCHSSKTQKPFYMGFPIAKDIIAQDIAHAMGALNMEKTLFKPGLPPPAYALAQIEYVVEEGNMPPHRYRALHWDAGLSADDKKMIREWIDSERDRTANFEVAPEFKHEPIQPLSTKPRYSEPLAALGEKLFHDKRLSGDGTLSCASCHDLSLHGGADGAKFSTGIKGQQGHINSPTVFNAYYNSHQFWDGRATDLQGQALGPVANPIEMGANWDDVIKTLHGVPEYKRAFKEILNAEPFNKMHVARAIAEFERSLITPNSPFDKYLRGDKAAISDQQIRGYKKFKDVGCIRCHAGSTMGGQSFDKLGVSHDYFADRKRDLGLGLHITDDGRFAVTKLDDDKHRFKVPTLRNVAKTAPYFHDGEVKTLSEAVRKMGYYQLDENLSEDDVQDITAFLESLTGEYKGQPVN